MASGTVGSTSTYVEGKTFSFTKSVAARVLDAAKAAKDVKHKHDAMERKGEKIPEAEKKNVFTKALKKEFIDNPVKKLRKSVASKLTGAASYVGLFGKKGRATERKIVAFTKKKIAGRKKGGTGSGIPKKGDKPTGGGTGSGDVSAFGSIVLDLERISNILSSMTSLFQVNLEQSSKISTGLGDIKDILSEQISIQQRQIAREEMRAKEASLESSQATSGTAASTSTIREGGGLGGLLDMLGNIKDLFGILKRLPRMFSGLLKGFLSKIPGGKALLGLGGKAKGAIGGLFKGAKGFMKGGLMKLLRPIFKRIPIFGGLIDFAVSLALGEPIGRAAAKSVGAMLGSALGTLIPIPGVGTIAGGIVGDLVGGSLYDAITGKGKEAEEKMSSGGVMIGEAGKEMVTPLSSAGAFKNAQMEDVYDAPYKAVAGGILAVTKDFAEGMGPVGQSAASVVKDDIAKLGRVFDIPSVNTSIDIGGAGLSRNTQAESEGKKYLEELVERSVEKIAPKKETKEKDYNFGGGSSGSSTSPTTTSEEGTPSTDPAASTPSSDPAPATGPTTLESLKENVQFVNKQQTGLFGSKTTISAVKGTDKAGVRRVIMVDEDGRPSDTLYYNDKGEVFNVDPTLGTKGISKLTTDQLRSLKINGAQLYRNLQTGKVVMTRRPPVGFYNYEKNGIVQEKLAQTESNAVDMTLRRVVTRPVSSLTDVERQNFGSNPYGPTADLSKIKAEDGISVSLPSGVSVTSRRGQRTLNGAADFHEGTDIGAPTGKKLYAFTNGMVTDVRKEGSGDGGYGNSVYWTDSKGWGHLYAHLDKFGKGIVAGTPVKKGKILGTVGNTGKSFGSHLHWELAVNPSDVGLPKGQGNRIDPLSKYSAASPFTGTPLPGDGVSADAPGGTTDDVNGVTDQPEDPFEAMDKAIEGMLTGLGLAFQINKGNIKSVEDYKAAESSIKTMATDAASKAADPATNPQHFDRGGGGGVTPTPQVGRPVAPAASATSSTISPSGATSQFGVGGGALSLPSTMPTFSIPSESSAFTPEGMSGFSFAPYSSSAIKYNPLSFQFAHLSQ